MSDRLDVAEQALRVAMGPRLDDLMPAVVRNAARQILEAAEPAVAGGPPREGEVWRDKIRNLRGKRCRTLVLQVIPENHERWSGVFVEHTTPGGDYRSKLADFLRDNERDSIAMDELASLAREIADPVPVAEPEAVFAGEKAARLADPQFRCPEHDVPMVEGKCPERRCPWKVETLDAPRVTREMVTGRIGSSPSFHGDDLVVQYCALCGAAISALGPEGSAIEAIEDYTEVHRAWHDRLERLLEARS